MADLKKEIENRRTFAIISHPDAGKTTITEKFLLYGGAIQEAGMVKGKKNSRHAVSDWMEIEKQRGISVTSSVLQFRYEGKCINILDTPGHQDFSEDTYRTLMAADAAVMVIDASKGVEAQTRKLFKVCAMRHIPIFTFVNKMDREAKDPFDLLDELENELGIETYAVNCTLESLPPEERRETMFYLAVLSHIYWTAASALGGMLGQIIPFDLTGIDFCMTALFVTIFIDQWETAKTHTPALAGLCVAVLALAIFGANGFMLPALLATSGILIFAGRKEVQA